MKVRLVLLPIVAVLSAQMACSRPRSEEPPRIAVLRSGLGARLAMLAGQVEEDAAQASSSEAAGGQGAWGGAAAIALESEGGETTSDTQAKGQGGAS